MTLAEIKRISIFQWSALLAALVGAVLVQSYFGFHPDVSWLLTLNERLIAGEQLYVDLLVVNPAIAVWMYRIPVLLAEATGIRAEIILHLMMAITAIASFALTVVILRHARLVNAQQAVWLAITLLALFYMVSAHTFAEREHIALLGLLPWLALQAWRCEYAQSKPHWAVTVLCGLGCAAIVLVKPYYALTILAPVLAICVKSRSLKPAFYRENVIGAAITIAFTGLFVALHPAFFADMLDIIMSTYAPYSTPFRLGYHTFVLCAVLVSISLRIRPNAWSPLTILLVASAFGHLAAVWVMGRALPYHVFPSYVLMTLAVMSIYRAQEDAENPNYLPALVCLAAIWAGVRAFSAVGPESAALQQYLADNHAGKTYLPISHTMEDGHPISRAAGMEFVAPAAFLQTTVYGDVVAAQSAADNPELLAQIERSKGLEHAAFRDTLLNRKPAIVVIPEDLETLKPDALSQIWSQEGPLGRPSDLYQLETTIDGYEVYIKR